MIPYYNLPVTYYALFGFAAILLMILAVWLLILVFSKKIRGGYPAVSIVVLAATVFLLQGITDISCTIKKGCEPSLFAEAIGWIPTGGVALLLFLLALSEGILFILVFRRKRTKPTARAMKESLDALPDGVCFFTPDGQPLLVNTQMQRISGELFHTELLNGNFFWDCLQSGDGVDHAEIQQSGAGMDHAEIQQEGNSVLVCTADKKVWDIRREELEIKHHPILSLVACDVTEQYRMNEELKRRNKIVEEVNERLRKYSLNMDEIIREKEILDAKMKVHDDAGRATLAFHSYLEQPVSERNREKLLLLWKYTISALKNEVTPSVPTDMWEKFLEAAKAVDIEVVVQGELPDSEREKVVLMAALHECLTNTVKHANGSRLYLSVERTDGEILLELKNNGKKPTTPIQETGGLKNLRQLVEETEGMMTITIEPEFVLRIRIPEEEKDYE